MSRRQQVRFSQKKHSGASIIPKRAGFKDVQPYHVNIPSFGDWGFVISANYVLNIKDIDIDVPTKYIENRILRTLFTFEKDIVDLSSKYSTLDSPTVLTYYMDGWRYWN